MRILPNTTVLFAFSDVFLLLCVSGTSFLSFAGGVYERSWICRCLRKNGAKGPAGEAAKYQDRPDRPLFRLYLVGGNHSGGTGERRTGQLDPGRVRRGIKKRGCSGETYEQADAGPAGVLANGNG